MGRETGGGEVVGMGIAIVTGASSGMGVSYVRALAQEAGVEEIWALARREEALRALQAQLAKPLRSIRLDLSEPDAPSRFQALLERERPKIDYLVNNAGFGKFCGLGELTMEQALSMVDVNCRALTGLCLAALPYLSAGSRIVNMASAASFQPLPYMELYAASKAFVRSFTRGLNRELRPLGATATAVCPYWVRTPFFQVAHAHEGAARITKYEVLYDPDRVVAQALRDAKRGRDMSVYGLWNKTQHLLVKLLPQSLVMELWLRRQGLPRA